MRAYICQKCREKRHSAGTDKPCDCGGVLKEITETGEYKRRIDELMQQGMSFEAAIRKVNGMIGRVTSECKSDTNHRGNCKQGGRD